VLEDLRALILAANTGAATVAWGARPQGSALPAILLTVVSETTSYTYAGAVDLLSTRVQADIYAASFSAAVAVDRVLAPAMNGFAGEQGDTEFAGIFLESRFDTAEEPESGGLLHRISRDLMVKHKET
jgi:hypothetical protein